VGYSEGAWSRSIHKGFRANGVADMRSTFIRRAALRLAKTPTVICNLIQSDHLSRSCSTSSNIAMTSQRSQKTSKVAAAFLRQQGRRYDLIIPVPPSAVRRLQPVVVLAQTIGAAIKVPVGFCVTTTRATGQLKNITNPDERAEALTGLYAVDAKQTRGKTILLFDDLFRSGSTLNAIISLVRAEGSAAHVDVLTITRTRSNQ
jgi:glutamine phosphoribosylpyrophosphate amidotransferase